MVRDKARRHCEDSPLHPRLLNPSLSESFVEALAAMMEKDPQKRIQTAEEVIDRLKPWAGEAVSSPLDPDEARLRREQNWETGSGSGDLSDTTVSFPEFAQPGLRMVNGAMLQAQPGLAAPIPVPIVAPPGSIPSPAASATAATDPPYGTLRIIQPGPATVAQPSVSVAPTGEPVAIETPAARLSVTDMLNAIAQESAMSPLQQSADATLPPVRRPHIEIDAPPLLLSRRKSSRVVIRGIIAAAVLLTVVVVWYLVTR